MIYVLFFWITYVNILVYARDPGCCSKINDESCRQSCHQLESQKSPTPQMQVLMTAAELCPSSLTEFWNCVNTTLPAVQLMSQWPGKTCCDVAKSKDCRRRCDNANTKESMLRNCREREEPYLFACIKRQEAGNKCCNGARVTSCGLVCHAIHLTGLGNHKATREVLADHCHKRDRPVEQCVHRQWQPQANNNGHNYMPCCDRGQTPTCRSKCRSVLRTTMSEDDRIEELIKACSEPQPTDPLWQCFLTMNKIPPNETTPVTSVDNAKLQCCTKASSDRCRDLCGQTFKKGWTYNAEFDTSCSYLQPVSTMEARMHNCLRDVEQPCKMGCSGLQFCRNFNNRPTEMFRSCTPEADRAAAVTFESWKKGVIKLPQLNIFVKDIDKCNPSMWQAVACALEIKPCSSEQSLITLCKEDCLYMLSQCADPSKLLGDQVPVLCNALPSDGACVSLDSYLRESPHALSVGKVIHPCNPNPCQPDEICLLRKRKCKNPSACLPYICHAACPLGEISPVMVPKGTALRLMETNSNMAGDKDCFLSCRCSHRRKIEGCRPLYCLDRKICRLGHNNIKAHGDAFTLDGRHCVCLAGEVICSQTSCRPDAYSPLYTGMPGKCPMRYSPVCAANGKSYPNNCIASCVGVTQIIGNKACSDIDMCSAKPCPSGFRCVPRPQVCLNDMEAIVSCPQYQCVDDTGDCNAHRHDPVCDTTGEEYNNVCLLFSHGRTLAYRGHCQDSCSTSGVVCGHDGETYSSECAARAAHVTVDYHSKCVAFGNLTKKSKSMSCGIVQCPPLHPRNCLGIIPTGGCCPICAAQMVLLWSPQLLTATAENTKSQKITVADVMNTLSRHVSLLDCEVYGYVSVNSELIVIMAPASSSLPRVQVEACLGEAKRLYNLIKTRSPNIISYLHLSPFIMASLEISTIKAPVVIDSTHSSQSFSNDGSAQSSSDSRKSGGARVGLSPGLGLLVLSVVIMHRKCVLRL